MATAALAEAGERRRRREEVAASAASAASVAQVPQQQQQQQQRRMLPPAIAVPMERLMTQNPRLSLSDVRHVQEWLAKQPHLPPLYDEELVPFLVSNDYSLERTKECVDKCLTMRTHAPELFKGRDPALRENQEQLQAFRVARLPRVASSSRSLPPRSLVVMGYAPRDACPHTTAFDGARSLALSTALMEIVALALVGETDGVGGGGGAHAGAGIVLLLDAGHVTLAHLAAMPLLTLHKLFTFLQEAAPLRVDAVHVLRLGPVGRRAVAMVKPFMGAELQRMMHFHSDDMTELYKEFPPEILPEDFGGSLGTIAAYHQELVDELVRQREWVLAQEERCVDESKRPGGAGALLEAWNSGHIGIQGSFRHLEVD